MSEPTVTIPASEYEDLLSQAALLTFLEGAGVDNWQGYSFAYEEYEEWKAQQEED